MVLVFSRGFLWAGFGLLAVLLVAFGVVLVGVTGVAFSFAFP